MPYFYRISTKSEMWHLYTTRTTVMGGKCGHHQANNIERQKRGVNSYSNHDLDTQQRRR